MNSMLHNCLIEKKKLQKEIEAVSRLMQDPKFWDVDTYRHIPYRLVCKVDDRIQEAKDLIKEFDEFKVTHDQASDMMYNATIQLKVLKYLIEDESIVIHE